MESSALGARMRPGTGKIAWGLNHMTRVLIIDDHPLVARATANEVRMVKRDAETRLAHSIEEAERVIAANGIDIATLRPLERADAASRALVAVRVGSVRLIDNASL